MPAARSIAKKKASPGALSQRIYEGLCREITTGKLRPGELLSRRQIAERYGASYTPVIEAMVRLENTGLIEAAASQMARVRQVSIETMQENHILREAYETQAVRLACERATHAEIDELYRRAEEVDARRRARDEARRDDPQGMLTHYRFHRRIAEVSRCAALAQALDRIELLRQMEASWSYVPNFVAPPRQHSLLVEPIARRDPLAADAAMREHLRRTLEKILRVYGMKMDNNPTPPLS
jgi:DNA-binding GntR family transcriptional regulator